MKRCIARVLTPLCFIVFVQSTHAQRMTYSDYDTQIGKSFDIQPLGISDFGDRIDYSTGATSFFVTTAQLPGNSELEVSARYVFHAYDNGLAGRFIWEADIPHLSGVFSPDTGWVAGSLGVNGNLRCSFPNMPSDPPEVPNTDGKQGTFESWEYWKGNHLNLPGGDSQPMNQFVLPSPQQPTVGGPYKWATNENWHFSCISLPAGGEGFLAINTKGEKYTFDYFAPSRPVPALRKYNIFGDTRLRRNEYRIFVSKIEDRFGNWVKYSYSGGDVTKIEANDGRTITFSRTADTLSVNDGTRVWTYDYTSGIKIAYPDLSTWHLTLANTIARSEGAAQGCSDGTMAPRYSGQAVINVKSRSGATGVFTLAARQRGLSYVHHECREYDTSGGLQAKKMIEPKAGGPYTYLSQPNIVEEIALISKVVSGAGLPTYTATISYGPLNNCFITSPWPALNCIATSPTTRTVDVTESGPVFTRYTYGNKVRIDAGLLLKTEKGTSAGNILRTDMFEWQRFDPIGGPVGVGDYDLTFWSFNRARLKKQTITQQGRMFVHFVDEFDGLARPSKFTSSSSP